MAAPTAPTVSLRPEVDAFIVEMVEKHAFERESLERLFTTAKFQPAIITAISRPGSSRPWHEYRPLFINPKRVAGGISFWDSHAATLERARKEFGVPEEIIAGVIGVETIYGAQTGKHRVLDALTTLAFDKATQLDHLIEMLDGQSSSEIIAALFDLELQGQVKQLPGKLYLRTWQ